MQQQAVSIGSREATGKGPNRRLRAEGKIPAVVYGEGSQSEKVSLNSHEFEKLMSNADMQSAILNLRRSDSAESSEENVIIRELQRDPVTRRILHVDLFRIRMDVENDFEVAIHSVGTPVGVREGGILETHVRTLEIRCLPTNLPAAITVDVHALAVNSSIHAKDIKVPEGVTIISDPDTVLYTVLPPKEAAVVQPVEGEAPAQPEVIGKKKAEGEEEAK
jgi:large subunit ribosomal protein L25